jgi:hypothetical protein
MSWIGETMEVIIVPEQVNHEDHFGFFHSLSEIIVRTKGKLVIQEYTGYDLKALNQKLYDAATNKEVFKRRILLDMTYGTDVGCSTNMTKAQPFYDFDLNFLNLHFMTDEDAKRWVHISLKLDDIIKRKYVAKYLQLLNNIHVDYRRKLKGDTLMFGHPMYSESSSPDELMRVLQESLRIPFEILMKLQFLENEALDTFQSLCLTYKGADPYKWYDAMRKVIPYS